MLYNALLFDEFGNAAMFVKWTAMSLIRLNCYAILYLFYGV